VHLHHVHGLAYTPDGQGLIVSGHVGRVIYRGGQWRRLATLQGVYVSHDFGTHFERIGPPARISAVLIDFDGHHVFFTRGEPDRLKRATLDGKLVSVLALPDLDETDFVRHIAQNPLQSRELAVATRRRNIFVSADHGRQWLLAAEPTRLRAGRAFLDAANERLVHVLKKLLYCYSARANWRARARPISPCAHAIDGASNPGVEICRGDATFLATDHVSYRQDYGPITTS
jgi:hypothetical protein